MKQNNKKALLLIAALVMVLTGIVYGVTQKQYADFDNGSWYSVYVNSTLQPDYHVVISEVRYAYNHDENFYVYDSNGQVVMTCTCYDFSLSHYPSIDDATRSVWVDAQLSMDDITTAPVIGTTEQQNTSEVTTEKATTVPTTEKKTEAPRVTTEKTTTATTTEKPAQVSTPKAELTTTVPGQSIWDYVPKGTVATEKWYDPKMDYSKCPDGYLIALQKRFDGKLVAHIIQRNRTAESIVILKDGNEIQYYNEAYLKDFVNGINYYNNLSKYCDTSVKWKNYYEATNEVRSQIVAKVAELTKNCKTDREKAHKIFLWVAKNIRFSYSDGHDNGFSVNRVWTSKKAVCAGFGALYEYMCVEAGIPCVEIISMKDNHAWNAVYLEGYWQCVDASASSLYRYYEKYPYQLFSAYSCFPRYQTDLESDLSDFDFTPNAGTVKTMGNVSYQFTSESQTKRTVLLNNANNQTVPKSIKYLGKTYTVQFVSNGITYQVTGASTVTVKKATVVSNKVTIPDTVTVGKSTFKVTKIACNLGNGSTYKTVVIGSNVSSISGSIASSKTTSVTIKTTKIKSWKKIKLNCKNKSSVKFKLPKSTYSAYKKAIKKKCSKVSFSKL